MTWWRCAVRSLSESEFHDIEKCCCCCAMATVIPFIILSNHNCLLLFHQKSGKMDVQDCKYYEARAKDVNLEDITSSEQNAAILARLRDNDPTFTAISIEDGPQVESNFVAREGDCMGWLGYFVGRSKQVETLSIYSFPDSLNIDAFLRGLGHNRSIQSLHINIERGENFQRLVSIAGK